MYYGTGINRYALVYSRKYSRAAVYYKVLAKQDYLSRCRCLSMVHMNTMEEYPTTALMSPVTSPLVAYFSSSPLVAPRFLAATIIVAIAPYPHAEIFSLSRIV